MRLLSGRAGKTTCHYRCIRQPESRPNLGVGVSAGRLGRITGASYLSEIPSGGSWLRGRTVATSPCRRSSQFLTRISRSPNFSIDVRWQSTASLYGLSIELKVYYALAVILTGMLCWCKSFEQKKMCFVVVYWSIQLY